MEKQIEFFMPGDKVRLNKNIPNRPEMYIIRKEVVNINTEGNKNKVQLIGFRCRWFDDHKNLCEAIFDTKDIEKI